MSKSNEEIPSENLTSEGNPQDYEILSEDTPNYDLSFKVVIIGNSGNSN